MVPVASTDSRSAEVGFTFYTAALALWMWLDVIVGRVPGWEELAAWSLWLGVLLWGVWDLRLGLFGSTTCSFRLESPQVFLTFDDGPDPDTTPAVLDALAQGGARACFFVVGEKAAEHPELTRRIVDEGHDVGIHGFAHSWRPWLTVSSAIKELERALAATASAVGTRSTLFRPPYGVSTPPLGEAARRLGLTVVGWSHRSLDTVRSEPNSWAKRAARAVGSGDILLLHDSPQKPHGRVPLGAVAVSQLLRELAKRGLKPVRLSEMLGDGAAPALQGPRGNGVPKRTIRVVSAAIERDGRYLITQRQPKAVLPLMWEFPGGRVEDGESDEQALKRELSYRLGVDTQVFEQISATEREYDDYVVILHLYRCQIGGGDPQPTQVADLKWVASSEFDSYEFTPADQKSMDALLFGERQDA